MNRRTVRLFSLFTAFVLVAVTFPSTAAPVEAQAVDAASLRGKSVRVSEPRFTAGFRVKANLGYLSGAFTYAHDRPLVTASAGFRF